MSIRNLSRRCIKHTLSLPAPRCHFVLQTCLFNRSLYQLYLYIMALHRSLTLPVPYLPFHLFVALFTIQLGSSLSDLPSVKLMQDIVCKHFRGDFSDTMLPEEKCRANEVQRELNIVNMGISISMTLGSTSYIRVPTWTQIAYLGVEK